MLVLLGCARLVPARLAVLLLSPRGYVAHRGALLLGGELVRSAVLVLVVAKLVLLRDLVYCGPGSLFRNLLVFGLLKPALEPLRLRWAMLVTAVSCVPEVAVMWAQAHMEAAPPHSPLGGGFGGGSSSGGGHWWLIAQTVAVHAAALGVHAWLDARCRDAFARSRIPRVPPGKSV